jgi:tRNA(fMet)-specific endonuclease VapC
VLAELVYGAYRSNRPKDNLELIAQFCQPFHQLPLDEVAAQEAGRLRAVLDATGTPIGPYDLQIAVIALVNGLTVVTHNLGEFGRVPGLRIEDWQTP